jgi:chitin synthase
LQVIGKYSRKPEEAMECLKYDQGEDRWLCTLMLKAGYRIRYCALASAKTNAPVGFDELFNQRRRWISSATANLIEILQDSRKLIKQNEHITYLYILYQILQLISTALTPGMVGH